MRPRRGTVLGLIAATAVFIALALPAMCLMAELYIQRELYRAFEAVGIMDPNGSLGGQILGFNFQREPRWAHTVARFIGAAASHGPAIVAAILVLRRVRQSHRRTLCGACGGTLHALLEPRCSRCGVRFGEEPRREQRTHLPWWLVRRLTLAVACYGAVYTSIPLLHDWSGSVLHLAEASGRTVHRRSGRLVYFTDAGGPFNGQDAPTAAWNWAYWHAARLAGMAAGLAAALAVYGLCAGPLGRTPIFGYRGPTRCGGCGYALAGLRDMRCPECGKAI